MDANTAEQYTYDYDYGDNQTISSRIHKGYGNTLTLDQRHTYDHWGRNTGNYHTINGGTERTLSTLDYNAENQLTERNLGGSGSAALQSLDYSYLPNGFLRRINQSSLGGTNVALAYCPTTPNPGTASATPDNNDLFYLELQYDQLYSGISGTAQKSGNISQLIWRTRGRDRQAYSFSYDYLDRLTQGDYYDIRSTGPVKTDDYFTRIRYADTRGNISEIDRQGWYPSGSCWTSNWIDILDFTYFPGTNRLKTVTDVVAIAARPYGFNGSSSSPDYQYDANGNQTYVPNRDVTLTYNHLNLPETMDFPGTDEIDILYDATGMKLRQAITQIGTTVTRDYVAGLEYVGGQLESIFHGEGRIVSTNGNNVSSGLRYEYNLTDHLGNVRMVVADLNGNGKIDQTTSGSTNEVLQESHYYPFGMKLDGPWAASTLGAENRYRYNGKELVEDLGLGWYDYGTRWYDASIARWTSVDKMADDLMQIDKSPYAYAWNDPVNLTDPDGNCPWCVGAVVGAVLDYGTQVAGNLIEGKSLGESLTEVDGTSIAISAVAGATGAGLVSAVNRGTRLINAGNAAQKGLVVAGEAVVDGTVSAGQQLATTGEIDLETTAVSVVAGGAIRTPVRDAVTSARAGTQSALDQTSGRAGRVAQNAEKRLNPAGNAQPKGRAGKVNRLQQEAQSASDAASQYARGTAVRSVASGVSASGGTIRIWNAATSQFQEVRQ